MKVSAGSGMYTSQNGAHTLLRVALGGTQTIDAPLNLVSVEGDEAGSLYI